MSGVKSTLRWTQVEGNYQILLLHDAGLSFQSIAFSRKVPPADLY